LSRTISPLIRTEGIGERTKICLTAERAGIDFNLARVPADFDLDPTESFDSAQMRALFERGVAAVRRMRCNITRRSHARL
jgi:hypothetical protein